MIFTGIEAIDWARMAAYIDGEGCIRIRPVSTGRRNHALELSLTNTDYRLLSWISTTFGGKVYKAVGCKTTTKKNVWRWQANPNESKAILEGCLPYFIVKREQAEIGIAFKNLCEQQKASREVVRGKGVPEHILSQRQGFVIELKSARSLGAKEEAS